MAGNGVASRRRGKAGSTPTAADHEGRDPSMPRGRHPNAERRAEPNPNDALLTAGSEPAKRTPKPTPDAPHLLERAPKPNERGTPKQRAERPETEVATTKHEPSAPKVEPATEPDKDECMICEG